MRFIFLSFLLLSCSTGSKQRNPATFIKTKENTNQYLDIRRVELPKNLKDKSEESTGIIIDKCDMETNSCHPLVNEVVTFEELRGLLHRHNISYSIAAVTLLASIPIILNVGGVGSGALAVGGGVLLMMGVTEVGLKVLAGVAAGIAIGTGITLGRMARILTKQPGRQMPLGFLPKDGPLLRKILSQREILHVDTLSKYEKDFTEIIHMIVEKRESTAR